MILQPKHVNTHQFYPDIQQNRPKEKQQKPIFQTAVDENLIKKAKEKQPNIFAPEQWEEEKNVGLTSLSTVLKEKLQIVWKKALEYEEEGKYEDAILFYNKCLAVDPSLIEAYSRRSECYFQLCDFQSSLLNLKKCCLLNPEENYSDRLAFIYYFYGQCLFDQRMFVEALDCFSRAAEIKPNVQVYNTRTIACLSALGRHGECLALVNKHLEQDRENPDLFVMRARLHNRFRNVTLAYYDIKDALSLNERHTEARKMIDDMKKRSEQLHKEAIHLNIRNRLRDALQKVSLAIETDPSRSEYHLLRGTLHRRLGDFNAAIDDFLLALDKSGHNEQSIVYVKAQRQLLLTYNDFAVECLTKKFYEEAIILLNKAIKGEKTEKSLYINRGDCFFKQSEFTFALQDYHQALELDPNNEEIRKRIGQVEKEFGMIEFDEKNFSQAERKFSIAIKYSPKVGQFYICRARCRNLLEKKDEAKLDLTMALHLDPENEEILGLMPRLFPGKSIRDVYDGRLGDEARRILTGGVEQVRRDEQSRKKPVIPDFIERKRLNEEVKKMLRDRQDLTAKVKLRTKTFKSFQSNEKN